MFDDFIESKAGQITLAVIIIAIMVIALLQGDGPY